MNRIRGIISDIKTQKNLSLVTVTVSQHSFTAIVIDTPETASWMSIENEIDLLFKETEVIIGNSGVSAISLRNRITGTIHTINQGILLSRIILDTDVGVIRSVITSKSVQQLGLKTGMEVVAMVKTNEMMLAQ